MAGKAESALEPLFRELYVKSAAAEYNFAEADFAAVLAAVGAKYLPPDADHDEAVRFYSSLRLEELALARACAAGSDRAWEVFLNRYRAKLYEMAGSIAHEDSVARELADSLYAELYGVGKGGTRCTPKLNYYMGRGSLEGWLRTVLAQAYVDRYRSGKRLVSLDEEAESGRQFTAPVANPITGVDWRLERATDEALAALPTEDRLVLAAYFLDGRTLAEIARMLRVHESTISRRVEKLTRNLRKAIVKGLIARGMDARQAEEALSADVRDLQVDVRARLAQGTAGAAFNSKDESG
ncbi:MAG: RNA polymerase sigma factor [Terriglobales bacterium]